MVSFIVRVPKTNRRRSLAGLVLGAVCCCIACSEPEPPAPAWQSAHAPEEVHDFGDVLQGERVEHVFRLANRGREPLRLESVEADEPLVVGEHPGTVEPRSEIGIPVTLDARATGEGELTVTVTTNDPEAAETVLRARARVVAPIEVEPQDRIYFLDVVQGQTVEGEVTVVDNRPERLGGLTLEAGDSEHFETSLETLEEGRRYRFTARLEDADVPGRLDETFTLVPEDPEIEPIPIRVVARVRETVFAEPAKILFGSFHTADLDDPHVSTRRLRVRSPGHAGLALLDLSSDLPFLELESAGDKEGAGHLVTVRIDPERLTEDPFEGSVRIETDHPDVPVLEIPVSGNPL